MELTAFQANQIPLLLHTVHTNDNKGAGAELEAEREVHSRGSAAKRVTRKVSNLVTEFHVCQPRFQVFCQYLSKNTENLILRRIIFGKNTIKKKRMKIFTGTF